jgi:hypothetical protein
MIDREGRHAVQTFVLVHTSVGEAEEVARRIGELADVETAEAVTGPYDVVVRVVADTLDSVLHDVLPRIGQVKGVVRMIACPVVGRRYSWVERLEAAPAPA